MKYNFEEKTNFKNVKKNKPLFRAGILTGIEFAKLKFKNDIDNLLEVYDQNINLITDDIENILKAI